jgi:hypothetical protein
MGEGERSEESCLASVANTLAQSCSGEVWFRKSCRDQQFLSSSTRPSARVAGVDERTLERLLELRLEIAALQQENSAYAWRNFHTAPERHTHGLRRERLEAIKEELMRLRTESTS